MLRLILIILPFFAPTIFYMAYRFMRFGRKDAGNVPPPIQLWKLFVIGAVLVFLNILFLVQFDGQPVSPVTHDPNISNSHDRP